MVKQFKEFALKGNVVDMAVGVIIGGAFGKIVSSIIEDLIMPVVGKVVGNVDFSNLYIPLSAKVRDALAAGSLSLTDAKKIGPVFAYGNFITVVINFVILAFIIFMMIRMIQNLKKKEETAPPPPNTKECGQCLSIVPAKAVKCAFCTSALLIALMVLFSALPASAEEANKPKKPWKSATEFSLVSSNGNSKSSSMAGKETFNYDWTKTTLELIGGGYGAKSNGVNTAERYNASEKGTYKMTERNYLYERGAWDKDRFAGIRDRYDMSAGLGRDLWKTKNNLLAGELGLGHISEERVNQPTNNFDTGRTYAKYTRTISPTSSFSQDAEYLANFTHSDDFRVNTETDLLAAISSHMALKLSYVWHYVGVPPTGRVRNDTITTVSLVATF